MKLSSEKLKKLKLVVALSPTEFGDGEKTVFGAATSASFCRRANLGESV
jgi:hypothetical protein